MSVLVPVPCPCPRSPRAARSRAKGRDGAESGRVELAAEPWPPSSLQREHVETRWGRVLPLPILRAPPDSPPTPAQPLLPVTPLHHRHPAATAGTRHPLPDLHPRVLRGAPEAARRDRSEWAA